jgi:sigma-B regulation protein RsbU (phosphoserine phosphatase)
VSGAPPETNLAAHLRQKGAKRPLRILLVEDNFTLVDLLQILLERNGLEVHAADSVASGVAAFRSFKPDAIVLDVVLPDGSGLDLLREVRKLQHADSFLPVIVLTDRVELSLRIESVIAGAHDFLSKPFNPIELLSRLRINLETKLLHDQLLAANARLERERDELARVQRNLLPDVLPPVAGTHMAGTLMTCSKAGGDYYDVVQRPDGKLFVTVMDVAGHGLPSAMHMAMARAIFRGEASVAKDTVSTFNKLTYVLGQTFQPGEFLTCLLLILDPVALTIEVLNAGHCPPMLIDRSTGDVEEIVVEPVMPIGVTPYNPGRAHAVQLRHNARVVLYTDGLVEQIGAGGRPFGEDGLRDVLKATVKADTQKFVERLALALREHQGTSPLRDDVTYLVIDTPPARR